VGSQVAASPSPFCRLAEESTASRLSGSLAKAVRRASSQAKAPVCQPLLRATTWSMSTLLPSPLTKSIVVPVYGSARVPLSTTQSRVPGLKAAPVRSRASTSLRVSQPLWSTSAQVGPNSSRS
jgi:hypothetical protein